MKKALAIICTVIECFLFLWLVVGLWACAVKVRELEEEQKSIRAFVCPGSQTKRLILALNSMQHETDMLRLGIEDQKMVVSNMQHSIDLLAFRMSERTQPEANQ